MDLKIRTLSGLSSGINVITRIPKSGRGRQKSAAGERGLMTKAGSERCCVAGFDCEERELQAKECRQPHETEEVKETDSPLEAPERNGPVQHVDFSAVRLVLNF